MGGLANTWTPEIRKFLWRGISCGVLASALSLAEAPQAQGQVVVYRRTSEQDRARIRHELDEQIAAKRKARDDERARAGARAFLTKTGVPLLTTRSERYIRRPDYTSINISYERIKVDPADFKKVSTQYTDSEVLTLVNKFAGMYALDANLVLAMIKVESNFNPNAVSPKGAKGLMQLMPETAKEMGVVDRTNPAQNIAGGSQLIAKLMSYYKGNLSLALAAYNAGPGAVKKYGGIPPYRETRGYIRDVLMYQQHFAKHGVTPVHLAKSRQVEPETAEEPASPQTDGKAIVHFNSGLSQPVDKIVEQAEFYFVEIRGRTFKIRKDHVKRVETPA